MERECSASDRLDTRDERLSVVWGGTADGEAEETRRGEHTWALLVVLFACVWQQLLPLLRKWSCNARKPPASDVAEQGCFIDENTSTRVPATSRKEAQGSGLRPLLP